MNKRLETRTDDIQGLTYYKVVDEVARPQHSLPHPVSALQKQYQRIRSQFSKPTTVPGQGQLTQKDAADLLMRFKSH